MQCMDYDDLYDNLYDDLDDCFDDYGCDEDLADSLSELYALLCFLGERYIKRIPENLFEGIKRSRNHDYIPPVDGNKGLEEQGFCHDTLAFVAYLKLRYWCDTKEEQLEYWRKLQANDVQEFLEIIGGIHIFEGLDFPEEE